MKDKFSDLAKERIIEENAMNELREMFTGVSYGKKTDFSDGFRSLIESKKEEKKVSEPKVEESVQEPIRVEINQPQVDQFFSEEKEEQIPKAIRKELNLLNQKISQSYSIPGGGLGQNDVQNLISSNLSSINGSITNLSASIDSITGASGVELSALQDYSKTLNLASVNAFNISATSIDKVDYVQFDVSEPITSAITNEVGRLHWNIEDDTLEFGTSAGSILQIGSEFYAHITNKTGQTLPDGCVVYINGAQGNKPTATSAQANDEVSSVSTIGLVTASILNNETGFATTQGIVRGFDTSTFTAGDILYLSTTEAGKLTNVRPVAPTHAVIVGYAMNSTNNGSVYVKVDNGYELNELHDVDDLLIPVDGVYIKGDTASQTWTSGIFADDVANVPAVLALSANTSATLQSGSLVLDGTSATGIKYDESSPSFGWVDIIGPIIPRVNGGPAPQLITFRGTGIQDYYFANNDVIDQIVFHIPHNYYSGSTELYLHPHWAHNGTSITGDFVIEWYLSYAKGYSREAFDSAITVTQTISTNITAHPQYYHNINELLIANVGGTGGLLDINRIEVDGILRVGMKVISIPTITGGVPNNPFIFTADLHCQSTGVDTVNRNFPFYL